MGVIKRKRKDSKFEVLVHAMDMRVKIDKLLLRDFGSKERIKDYRIALSDKNISDEDMVNLGNILNKYELYDIIDEFPKWYIGEERRVIKILCTNLVHSIIKANSLFPNSVEEYHERRKYQSEAIGYCEILYIEFQHIMKILNVNVNKFIPFAEMLETELKLLKAWRKKDNRILKQIKEKENKE